MPWKIPIFRQLPVSHALIALSVFPAVRSSDPPRANRSGSHSPSGVGNTFTSRCCLASMITTLVAVESRRLTARLGHRLLAIGFGFLQDAGGGAAVPSSLVDQILGTSGR